MSQPSRTILCTDVQQVEPDVQIIAPPASSQSGVKKKNRRVQAKKYFLTFPQCTVGKQLALTRLLFKYPKAKWIIVAEEKHKDGTPHLHVAFWLSSTVRSSRSDQWDFIAGKHGNYQVMRDPYRVVKYVTKENNFMCYQIDVPSWLKAHKTKTSASFQLVAKLMQDGQSIEELDSVYPGMVANNLQKLQKYDKFLVRKKRKLAKKEKEKWKPIDVSAVTQDFRLLALWLNGNLNGTARTFKKKQLWLWGPSNSGKTTLALKLSKYFRMYMVPLDCRTLDDYEDSEYDLIVLDEFKGQKSITWMNGFVQGGHFPVSRRYASTLKTVNHPVIVLSNYSIAEAYERVAFNHPERLDSLKNRFYECKVTRFIELYI